jgi:hypothetical protein
VVQGNFIVKNAVGAKPAILGKKLKQSYYRGENYFELDVDIASSSVGTLSPFCSRRSRTQFLKTKGRPARRLHRIRLR